MSNDREGRMPALAVGYEMRKILSDPATLEIYFTALLRACRPKGKPQEACPESPIVDWVMAVTELPYEMWFLKDPRWENAWWVKWRCPGDETWKFGGIIRTPDGVIWISDANKEIVEWVGPPNPFFGDERVAPSTVDPFRDEGKL